MKKLLILLLTLQTTAVYADEIDTEFVKRFSTLPTYSNAQISPDGKIISVVFKKDEKNALAFFKASDFSLIDVLQFKEEDEQVGSYAWASNKRVVISINYKLGALESPISRGELFSVNFDLSKPSYIYGIRRETSSSKKTIVDKFSAAYLIDPLIEDPNHVLVAAAPFGQRTKMTILRLNIFNGGQKSYGKAPPGAMGVLTDSEHEPRFAVGTTKDEIITYAKDVKKNKWNELTRSKYLGGGKISPVTFTEDDSSVIVLDDTNSSTAKIKAINLDDSTEEVLFHHPKYDPYPQLIDRKLIAVGVGPDYSHAYWLDDGIEAQVANQLVRAFNDGNDKIFNKANVRVTSMSKDRNKAIIRVEDDRSSPRYWLFDRENNRLVDFLVVWPEIEETDLSQTKPFKFTNSDGVTLHGYFTEANNFTGEKPPLIVLPHGGPIGPRDFWGFDPDVQILSNAGYSVMKINYRGSGGYGRDFLKAGMGEPGRLIQKDIIEATEWIIEQGWVDENRVGIYGASFGGYSAVQAPILRPDLFKVGVSLVGLFDLNMDFREGGCQADYGCKNILNDQWGSSPSERAKMSPVNYIEKLKAPVLIVGGEEDDRCPPEQQYALENALKKHNKEYKLIMVPKEGHGFINPENRFMFYREMLEHFNKYL